MDRHGGDVNHKVPVHFKSDLIKSLEVDEPVAKAGKGEVSPNNNAVFTSPNVAYTGPIPEASKPGGY
jgi:hypothetical protein